MSHGDIEEARGLLKRTSEYWTAEGATATEGAKALALVSIAETLIHLNATLIRIEGLLRTRR